MAISGETKISPVSFSLSMIENVSREGSRAVYFMSIFNMADLFGGSFRIKEIKCSTSFWLPFAIISTKGPLFDT